MVEKSRSETRTELGRWVEAVIFASAVMSRAVSARQGETDRSSPKSPKRKKTVRRLIDFMPCPFPAGTPGARGDLLQKCFRRKTII